MQDLTDEAGSSSCPYTSEHDYRGNGVYWPPLATCKYQQADYTLLRFT